MIPFPFFPLPAALLTPGWVALWATVDVILLVLAAVFIMFGLYLLARSGFSGDYNREDAVGGLVSLAIVALIIIFHNWFVMAIVGGLIIYWIGWRLLLKNILVAIGLIR